MRRPISSAVVSPKKWEATIRLVDCNLHSCGCSRRQHRMTRDGNKAAKEFPQCLEEKS
jgi:hypothetical protein